MTIKEARVTTKEKGDNNEGKNCNLDEKEERRLSFTISLANGENCTIPGLKRNYYHGQKNTLKTKTSLGSCSTWSFPSQELSEVRVKLEGTEIKNSKWCSAGESNGQYGFEITTSDDKVYVCETQMTVDGVEDDETNETEVSCELKLKPGQVGFTLNFFFGFFMN